VRSGIYLFGADDCQLHHRDRLWHRPGALWPAVVAC
jgi:hypothetical protein